MDLSRPRGLRWPASLRESRGPRTSDHVMLTFPRGISYFVLSGIQLLYAYYFEGSKIYTGKRKSLSKRVRFHPSPISPPN